MTLPPSLRNRYNRAVGDAAEAQCIAELQRRYPHASIWQANENRAVRYSRDIHGLFDLEVTTTSRVLYVQVKATARLPYSDPIWQARYLAWVRPAHSECYMAWLTPTGTWRVWSIEADGRRVELVEGWG